VKAKAARVVALSGNKVVDGTDEFSGVFVPVVHC